MDRHEILELLEVLSKTLDENNVNTYWLDTFISKKKIEYYHDEIGENL